MASTSAPTSGAASRRHPQRGDLVHARTAVHDAAGRAADVADEVTGAVADVVDDAARAVGHVIEEIKPHLRGWLHVATAPCAMVAGLTFVCLAPSPRARLAAGVFAATSFVLFATSALFHRGRWSRRAHDTLRRLDHANIFLVIAGTYTPFGLLLLTETKGALLLAIVWSGAVAGILFRTLWLSAPRWLYTPVYLAMGWLCAFFVRDMFDAGGAAVIALLGLGGLLYTLGAVVYGTRWPNPSPRWFGFHEIFHVFTVLAFAAHCTAVGLIVLRA